MNLFQKKFKYYIEYKDISYPLAYDPSGWETQAIAFSRNDNWGLNDEISESAKFAKDSKDRLLSIFSDGGFQAKAYLSIKKRLNMLNTSQFYRARLDFTTTKVNRDYFEIECKEDSILSRIKSKKSQNYSIPMPTKDMEFLYYDGCDLEATNTLVGQADIPGAGVSVSSGSHYAFAFSRSTITYSSNIELSNSTIMQQLFTDTPGNGLSGDEIYPSSQRYVLHAKNNITIKLTISSGKIELAGLPYYSRIMLKISKGGLDVSSLQSSDISLGKQYLLPYYNNSSIYVLKPSSTSGDDVYSALADYYLIMLPQTHIKDGDTHNFYITECTMKIPLLAGANMQLCVIGDGGWVYNVSTTDLDISIVDMSKSVKYESQIQVVSHYWWIKSLLNEILEGDEFTLIIDDDLFDNHYIPMISCSDALQQFNSRSMYGNIKDAFDSLYVLGMTAIMATGNTIRICKIEKAFPSSPTRILNSVIDAEVSFDTSNIYNIIEFGYDKGDFDDTNGTKEVLAKNEAGISIDLDDDKKMNLVHPYIASPYAIENYLKTKKDSSDTDNDKDNKIFLFACNTEKNSSGRYTLCRKYKNVPTGTFSVDTYYNLPISPMRILIRHKKFLMKSCWRSKKNIIFTSGTRNVNVSSQMEWEDSIVWENGNIDYDDDYIFLPLIYSFKSNIEFDSISEIQGDNAYIPIRIENSSIGSFEGWIKNVSFNIGKQESQKFELIAKTAII